MALLVDLSDDDAEPPQDIVQGGKPVWHGDGRRTTTTTKEGAGDMELESRESAVDGDYNPNRNSMTAALSCYP